MGLKEVLALVIAYLLGSIPFAYIIARISKGIDIRDAGTKNVGAMNTWREAGTAPGFTVLVLDIAKGSLAVVAAKALGVPLFFVMSSGIAAVCGHNWPVFLGFKGGRGAATSLGVIFAILPEQFGVSILVVATVFLFTWNTSLAIGIGFIVLMAVLWATDKELAYILYPSALAALGVLRNFGDFKHELAKQHSLKKVVFRRLPFPNRR